ncbi:MAG: DUF1269 domain-containing protein [Anaerolineales bacterium]
MTYEMLVVSFPGEGTADEVLTALRGLKSEEMIDFESSAVIVRRENDKVSIRENKDYNAQQGALVGAAGGLLLGALLGKGAIKGALFGAGAGAVSGEFIDMGLEDDFLKGVGDQLSVGHSAIVALVDFTHLDPAVEELSRFEGGTILQHELSDEAYQKLSEAVED